MAKFDLEKYFKKYSYNVNKVIGIDPYDFTNMYRLEGNVLTKVGKKDVKSEYLLSTYLISTNNRNVMTYEFTIQKNVLEKVDIDDYIETKCYEDMGLDDAEEYIFKHKLIENIEKEDAKNQEVAVEVVIIIKKEFEEYYSEIIKEYGYLDFVTYSGYLFKALYEEEILEPKNDLFIYFLKGEIFITLYSEGEFRQTSIMPDGLETIYETLNETLKLKDFSFEDFLELLVKNGLDSNNYEEDKTKFFSDLSELFSNRFLVISNQIHVIIRKFGLTTIDRIFMSTLKGSIPGISEFANMYLGVEANDLKFDREYNPDNLEIDQFLFLSMLYAKVAYSKNIQDDNVESFKRPPTFFYRKSGQLISISIASLIASLAYPLYQLAFTYIIDSQNRELSTNLQALTTKESKLKKTNNKLSKDLELKQQTSQQIKSYIGNSSSTIDDVYKQRWGYIPKSVLISKLSKYFIDNNVFLLNLTYNENSIDKTDSKKSKNKRGATNNFTQMVEILVKNIIHSPIYMPKGGYAVIDKKDKFLEKKTSTTKKSETVEYIVFNVFANKEKYITNMIKNIISQEGYFIATEGYQKSGNFYIATLILIIKVKE